MFKKLRFTNVLVALTRAIISQNCKDQVTDQVLNLLSEQGFLSKEKFLDPHSKEIVLEIIRKSGCYRRKYEALSLVMTLNPQTVDQIKELVNFRGIGPKTIRVALATIGQGPQVIVDVNVLKAHKVLTNFKGDAEKLRVHLESLLGLEKAARLCDLLWAQRKNFCTRRNCTQELCNRCKEFYSSSSLRHK